MKTAIILAAGVGSRLRPLTESMPKCCVPVGGLPLIRRVVQQLLSVEPNMPIYIVTGYLGQKIIDMLSDVSGNIFFIENSDYATTNNMESCRLALEVRKETGPSLVINADCAYDNAIVEKMVQTSGSCIAVDTSVYVEENMKVLLDSALVKDISKKIPDGSNVATSVDLYSFSGEHLSHLLEIMQRFHSKDDLNQWTEVAIAELVKTHDVGIVDISGKDWVEIDNFEDLKIANERFSK